MKLTLVSPFPLFPIRSGAARRSTALAQHLVSQGHEVSLCCPLAPDTDIKNLPEPFRWHVLGQHHRLGHLFSPKLYGYLIEEAKRGGEGIVLSFPFQVLPVLAIAWRFRIPWYLDAHNVEHARFASLGKGPASLVLFLLELLAARTAREIFTVSPEDQLLFQKRFGRRARCVPNGVDTKVFLPASKPAHVLGILFFGNMAYEPNRRAVRFINDDLAPLLRAALPGAVLRIAGPHPPWLRYAPNVKVLGPVENIQAALHQADLVIAPLDEQAGGGGTRLKIIEAMACGKNILCTSAAAHGLPQEAQNALTIVPLKDTGKSIVDFFEGRWKRDLGAEARAAALRLDWQACFKELAIA